MPWNSYDAVLFGQSYNVFWPPTHLHNHLLKMILSWVTATDTLCGCFGNPLWTEEWMNTGNVQAVRHLTEETAESIKRSYSEDQIAKYYISGLFDISELYSSYTAANCTRRRRILISGDHFRVATAGSTYHCKTEWLSRKLPGLLRVGKTVSTHFKGKQQCLRPALMLCCEDNYRGMVHQTVALGAVLIFSSRQLSMLAAEFSVYKCPL